MADVLAFLALLTAGALASILVATALAVRAIRRRNRIAPRVATAAPLWWLCSPLAPARLHRRLRMAALVARNACPPVSRRRPRSTVHELADDVEELALSVDLKLVQVARSRRALAALELADEVEQVEELARRVAAFGRVGAGPSRVTIEAVEDRLEALEAARREIDGLDVRHLGQTG